MLLSKKSISLENMYHRAAQRILYYLQCSASTINGLWLHGQLFLSDFFYLLLLFNLCIPEPTKCMAVECVCW